MNSGTVFGKGVMLASLLLLAGCSEEFAILHFDRGHASDVNYRDLLLDALAERGISIDQLDVTVDRKNNNMVHLNFKNSSFDLAERKQIRGYLEALLADRKVAGYEADIEAHPDKVSIVDPRLDWGLARIIKQAVIRPAGRLRMEIIRANGVVVDVVQGVEPLNMRCKIIYPLKEPLPYQLVASTLHRVEGVGAASNAIVYGPLWDLTYPGAVPATIKFRDSNLARLFDGGKVRVGMRSRIVLENIKTIEFIIDGLGEDVYGPGPLSPYLSHGYQNQCNEIAAALGRPFSFHMGSGMDRLSGVVFRGTETQWQAL